MSLDLKMELELFFYRVIPNINNELDNWFIKPSYGDFIKSIEPYNRFLIEYQFIPLCCSIYNILLIDKLEEYLHINIVKKHIIRKDYFFLKRFFNGDYLLIDSYKEKFKKLLSLKYEDIIKIQN